MNTVCSDLKLESGIRKTFVVVDDFDFKLKLVLGTDIHVVENKR
jgi:hypothetical protein